MSTIHLYWELVFIYEDFSEALNVGFVFFWFHLWRRWRTILILSPLLRIRADSKGIGVLPSGLGDQPQRQGHTLAHVEVPLGFWNEGKALQSKVLSPLPPFPTWELLSWVAEHVGTHLCRLCLSNACFGFGLSLLLFKQREWRPSDISKCTLCLLKLWETPCTGINQKRVSLFI